MKSNQRGREEGFQRLSDIMHVLRLQRRHAQPVLASWYSRREGGRTGEGDEDSDDDGNAVNGYLMVLHRGGDEESEEEEEEQDERANVSECTVS